MTRRSVPSSAAANIVRTSFYCLCPGPSVGEQAARRTFRGAVPVTTLLARMQPTIYRGQRRRILILCGGAHRIGIGQTVPTARQASSDSLAAPVRIRRIDAVNAHHFLHRLASSEDDRNVRSETGLNDGTDSYDCLMSRLISYEVVAQPGHGCSLSECPRRGRPRAASFLLAPLNPTKETELVIEAYGLTKDYGAKRAVDDLSFSVRPSMVTGFLGPNGSGKSTTMRLILGLDAPSAGDVTVNGKHLRDHSAPLHEVGALLEARSVHTGRSARDHLLALAQTHGISRRRVNDLIELVGLTEVAGKRVGQFSMGMGQRLGIASALLGDPGILLLDEPANGLDPEGVHWIRNLLKDLALEGRTVFVSSHLMSEMALTAEHLIVIGRGRLVARAVARACPWSGCDRRGYRAGRA